MLGYRYRFSQFARASALGPVPACIGPPITDTVISRFGCVELGVWTTAHDANNAQTL